MTDKDERKAAFLPFHALNHFMRDDFRREVVRTAVLHLPQLDGGLRGALERQVKRSVSVPGFRNSVKAPPSLIARHLPDAFEKNPDLVKTVLAAWAAAKTDLRQQVYDLLAGRGWELLPLDADRTVLPGFLTTWPPREDFEVINTAFAAAYPGASATTDEVSLMAVWLAGRLPVDVPDDGTGET
jgi:hypothetical protein